jgi:anti-sigma B factor antagonist
MRCNIRKSGDVTILDLQGRLTIGEGDYILRENVRRELSEGARKILVNLEQAMVVDSSGIGEMVSGYTTTAHHGGKLKLLKPTPKLRDILHITQLITIFEIYDDEKEAVASYG